MRVCRLCLQLLPASGAKISSLTLFEQTSLTPKAAQDGRIAVVWHLLNRAAC
jgi:hypothetical protein